MGTVRARNPLPRGAATVGAGLLVLGGSVYAYLSVAARAIGPAEFSTLSVLWVLVYTVGPGLFSPLEQEVGRALAARRARGTGGGPLLRRAAVLGCALALAVLAACLLARPWLQHHLLGGNGTVFYGLLLAIVGLAPAHLSRGALAATGRFRAYGSQLALDGVLRLVGCVVLAVAGVRLAGPYGMVLGIASLCAVVITVGDPRSLAEPGPPAPWRELSSALGWLLGGALLSQGPANAGVVAVDLLRAPGEQAVAGQFLAGLVLARLPLFLFAAVQAALLPRLAALIGAGKLAAARHAVRRMVEVVVAVTGLACLGAWALGPQVLRAFFGSRFDLSRATLMVLAGASGAYMLAVVLGQGLLALGSPVRAAIGWASGVAAFVAVVAFGADLVGRVERAYLAGSLVSMVILAGLWWNRLRTQDQRSPVVPAFVAVEP